jgi:hypothetical protein
MKFWTKLRNKHRDSLLLFFLNLSHQFWLIISINLGKKFVQNFRNRLLLNVFEKEVDDVGFLVEDIRDKLLLLSADEKRNKLAEVT